MTGSQTTIAPNAFYHGHVRTDVVPHIPNTGGTLLDFGGGYGATGAHLRAVGSVDRAGVADLIDNSDSNLELDFSYQADLETPGLISKIVDEHGQFQIILALDILEHLRDPWHIAAQLADGLAENGYLVISLPNIRNYRALGPLLFRNKWDYKEAGILDRTHLRFFVRETAIELVEQTGLHIHNVASSASGGRKIAWLRRLTLGVFNSFTDRQYIIVAQKRADKAERS